MSQTIHLATDHAGFAYKELIKTYLTQKGYTIIDHGAHIEEPTDDYPVYIHKAALEISKAAENYEVDPQTVAIVLGGSGQGEAIAAGRLPYVRTTVCYGGSHAKEILELGRNHNNANVLAIGARFIQSADVLEFVSLWLKTPFSKEPRHIQRLEQIEEGIKNN